MGSCSSHFGADAPEIDVEQVKSIVETYCIKLPQEIKSTAARYHEEMKKAHPEKWEVDGETGDKKLFLQHQVDDENKVKLVALLVVGGKQFKSSLSDEVWKMVEPKVSEKLNGKPEFARKVGLKAGRAASDKIAHKAADEIIKKLAEQFEGKMQGDSGAKDGKSEPQHAEKSEHPEKEKAHGKQAPLQV